VGRLFYESTQRRNREHHLHRHDNLRYSEIFGLYLNCYIEDFANWQHRLSPEILDCADTTVLFRGALRRRGKFEVRQTAREKRFAGRRTCWGQLFVARDLTEKGINQFKICFIVPRHLTDHWKDDYLQLSKVKWTEQLCPAPLWITVTLHCYWSHFKAFISDARVWIHWIPSLVISLPKQTVRYIIHKTLDCLMTIYQLPNFYTLSHVKIVNHELVTMWVEDAVAYFKGCVWRNWGKLRWTSIKMTGLYQTLEL
jgi:hypothetical protein